MLINMNIGGTEKALLNMITEIPRDKYEITILMLEEYGGFLNEIPEDVKIEYVKKYKRIKMLIDIPLHINSLNEFKKGNVIKGFNLLLLYLISKVFKERSLLYKYILKDHKELPDKYDIAVAYAGPMDLISYFILKKIKAKKKIQWIHFDIEKIGFNKHFANKFYKEFDKIFVVSNEAKDKLVNTLPILNEKTSVFFNMVSPRIINKKSKEGTGFKDNFNGLRILTVGRLTIEKGQDLAIAALVRLLAEGYNVKWYCLGDGNYKKQYEKLVKDHNLQDSFVFLEADPNPYTYIDQCDLYVQPSRYEGYCITLLEAKTLNKPIITTDVNGAKEQIVNGKTGLIVGIDEYEIFKAIKRLLHDNKLINEITENLRKEEIESILQYKEISDL